MEELGLPTRITNLPVSPSPSVFLKDFGTLGWFLSVWLLTFWQCCLNQGAIFTIQTDSKAVYEEVRKLLIMVPVWVVDWLVLMEMCMKYTVSQCRHWLKLWRRYFHSFGTDTRFCSPTPAWQSYFMSDFSYFFLIVLSQCSNPQSAKYSRAHTSDIQTAPWPWAGTHTHFLGSEPRCFTSCWSRISEWLSCWWRICTGLPSCESAALWDSEYLESGLLLFLARLETHLPALCAAGKTAHQHLCTECFLLPKCETGNSQLSLKRQRAFLNWSADTVNVWSKSSVE